MEWHDRLKDLSVFAEPESHCGYLVVAGIPFLWLVGTICRREIKHFSKGEKMRKNAVIQLSLTFISATGRKNSIPLYWDSYIIMDYDGTRWNSRQLFLIDDTACAAIPQGDDRRDSLCPYLLSLSGYPRPPITHHQRNNIPPCPCEQSGKKAMSGGIHSTGFPCPNAAGFCLYPDRKGSVTEVAGYCPTKKNRKDMKTKIILAGILLLLCGSSFAQRIVAYSDLRTLTDAEDGTVVHYLKDGKCPLSGEYRILRGPDEESVHFSKGVKQGEYRRYRDDVLREKGVYADGKRHGLFVTYYQDGKTPQREAPMQHGKIEGTVRTWFADGKPDMIQEYRNGKKNGKEQRFAPKTGRLIYEASYTDDKKEGKQWELNEDTSRGWLSETVSHYKNGELDGPYEYTAHKHGKLYLHESGAYKAGYKHGVWKKTDDDGIVTQGEYTDGRETGHWVRYDSTSGEILNEWDK